MVGQCPKSFQHLVFIDLNIFRNFLKISQKTMTKKVVDVQYPIKLYEIHSDLQFLPQREKLGKVEKLATS